MSRVLSFTTTEDSDLELDHLMEIWGMNRSETIREAISRAYNRELLFSSPRIGDSTDSHKSQFKRLSVEMQRLIDNLIG